MVIIFLSSFQILLDSHFLRNIPICMYSGHELVVLLYRKMKINPLGNFSNMIHQQFQRACIAKFR